MRTANPAITFGSGATTKSMGASFTSDPVRLENIINFAIQAVWAGGGSPTGTLTLECSCDPGSETTSPPTVTNWTTVTGSDQAITASGNHVWNVQNAGYRWARIVWTRTSGTDTFSARLYAKGL